MKNKKIIPIMTCFDDNYVIPAGVAFYSLLENSNSEYFYKIYVLHSNITQKNQKKLVENIKQFSSFSSLEFIDMKYRFDDIWKRIYSGGHFSKEVMYKLLVASVFPQYEKLIITDVDVVFLNDISKSYTEFDENENHYFAVVKPVGKINSYMENYKKNWTLEEIEKLGKFCGGYLIANLKQIRKDEMEQVFLDSFVENGYRLNQMEQDILNLCCYNKVKFLPLNYVVCSYMWDLYKTEEDFQNDENYKCNEIKDSMENTIQLHYATGIKPWKNPSCTMGEVWFKYLLKTNMVNDYIINLPKTMIIGESTNLQLPQKDRKSKIITMLKPSTYKSIAKRIFGLGKKEKEEFKKELNIKNDQIKKLERELLYKDWLEQEYSKSDFTTDILIIDDVFPNELSGFRFKEYNEYLNNFSETLILSDNSSFVEEVFKYKELYPNHYNKVKKYNENLNITANLCIMTFLNNTYKYLDFVEKNDIPFIFTLYPGGGFALNNETSNKKLKKIVSSKNFKKVIVTQKTTLNYLINEKICSKNKIEYINGSVVNIPTYHIQKTFYGEKDRLDICFVAKKYMSKGKDKGYDTFIEVMKTLIHKYKNIYAHVVGNFDENEIDIAQIKSNIKFYGLRNYSWFKEFYKDKDIIISPNIPFALGKGYFDGFPLTCVLDAMLNNVLAICTDELNNNVYYKDKKDMIIIKPTVKEIVDVIEKLYNEPKLIESIAISGNKTTRVNYKYQIKDRIKIIEKIMEEKNE